MPGLDHRRWPLAPKENSNKARVASVAPWNLPYIFFLYLSIRTIVDLGASLPSWRWSNEPNGTFQDPRNGFVRLYTNLIFVYPRTEYAWIPKLYTPEYLLYFLFCLPFMDIWPF